MKEEITRRAIRIKVITFDHALQKCLNVRLYVLLVYYTYELMQIASDNLEVKELNNVCCMLYVELDASHRDIIEPWLCKWWMDGIAHAGILIDGLVRKRNPCSYADARAWGHAYEDAYASSHHIFTFYIIFCQMQWKVIQNMNRGH